MNRFAPLLTAVLLAAVPAAADDSPDNIAKYRHNVMEGIAKNMVTSSMILKGEISRPGDLIAHAKAIEAVSQMTGELFPEGTGPDSVKKTDALATVWEKPDEWKTAVAKFQDVAKQFVEAAESGEMEKIKPAFSAVGKSCGSCHDSFREEDH